MNRAPADSAMARIAYLSSGDQHPKSRITDAPLFRTSCATQIMRPSRMSRRPSTVGVAVVEQWSHPFVGRESQDAFLVGEGARPCRFARAGKSDSQVEYRPSDHEGMLTGPVFPSKRIRGDGCVETEAAPARGGRTQLVHQRYRRRSCSFVGLSSVSMAMSRSPLVAN